MGDHDVRPPQIQNLLNMDGYLNPYAGEITRRYQEFRKALQTIEDCGGLDNFTQSYKEYGLIVHPDNSIHCLEWAPGAEDLALVGDFNEWSTDSHRYQNIGYGKWKLVIPANPDGSCHIAHNSVIKVAVKKNGLFQHKLSPWAHYVTCAKDSIIFHQQFYNPPHKYTLKEKRPKQPDSMRIYEAHVGISSKDGKINSYREFADEVVPRIHKQGYNSIQLMAVMEHAYYASFGYQVTSFFAASSRCGPPDDLKYLVDKAHSLGIFILLDVVHSHASKNVADGLNLWDGSCAGYFHVTISS